MQVIWNTMYSPQIFLNFSPQNISLLVMSRTIGDSGSSYYAVLQLGSHIQTYDFDTVLYKSWSVA